MIRTHDVGSGEFLFSASETRKPRKAATQPSPCEPSGVSEVITTKFSNRLCALLSRSHLNLKSHMI